MNGFMLWFVFAVPPAQPEEWVPSPMPSQPPIVQPQPRPQPRPICPPGGA